MQERNENHTFKARWTPQTVMEIIWRLNHGQSERTISLYLIEVYDICLRSCQMWIDMAARVMAHMNDGHTLEQALELDHQWRNQIRRKKARKH